MKLLACCILMALRNLTLLAIWERFSFSSLLDPFPPQPAATYALVCAKRLWNSSWLPRFFHSKRGNLAPFADARTRKTDRERVCLVVNELPSGRCTGNFISKAASSLLLYERTLRRWKISNCAWRGRKRERLRKNCSRALLFSLFSCVWI